MEKPPTICCLMERPFFLSQKRIPTQNTHGTRLHLIRRYRRESGAGQADSPGGGGSQSLRHPRHCRRSGAGAWPRAYPSLLRVVPLPGTRKYLQGGSSWNIKRKCTLPEAGVITKEMRTVAQKENLPEETIRERVARGTICIPANRLHTSLSAEGIGEGLKTKINVNLGISATVSTTPRRWKR